MALTRVSTGISLISDKVQSVSSSVSSNALTLSFNGGVLDFRSSSLTNGTSNTITVAANSIVIPSGATLGTINTIQSRLVLIEAYNAGSPVACVVNLSGGVQLDETNLISPVLISSAADSANVIYSASTVASNSPYRVVGVFDITQTVAGTWASDATLKQGVGGQSLSGLSSLGYGQTWQNLTGSRSGSVTYYNTTGKPIYVQVKVSSTSATASVIGTVAGIDVNTASQQSSGFPMTSGFIVPNGVAYSFAFSNVTVQLWSELR
jgi:hypothetical protein